MKNIAVITGASSGMGKEFVKQLDGKFDEIWGIGLSQYDLDELGKEIKTPFKGLELDLTEEGSFEKYIELLNAEAPNVKWLVNAAGFGKFGRHNEINIDSSADMIDLNCKALMKMTEITLHYMQNGGRIVEIASVAGFQPIPYMAVYGASKAFVVSYARALNQELKYRNIKVTCVCPFWTKTNFFNVAQNTKAKNPVVTKYVAMYYPEDVVKKAIKDTNKGKELSICGFIARSQVRLVNMLPKKLVMKTWISQQRLKKKYRDKYQDKK